MSSCQCKDKRIARPKPVYILDNPNAPLDNAYAKAPSSDPHPAGCD
jgi:hypothetical protein